MSLNIPPASVTPAQAAKKLRVLIKQWTQQAPQKSSSFVSETVLSQMDERNKRIVALMDRLAKELREVRNAGKERKAALVSAKVYTVEESLNELRVRYNSFNSIHRSRLASLLAQKTVGPGKAELEEAYRLVQVLPVLEQSPGGQSKADNTLRAMLAILKAHHGLLEKGPEDLPTPEMPIVLLREVEKVVEGQEKVPVGLPIDVKLALPEQEVEEDEDDEEEDLVQEEELYSPIVVTDTISTDTTNPI